MAQSAGNRGWYGITSTPSGDVYAVVYGGDIYKQTGGTGSFVAQSAGDRSWIRITSTPSGDVYAVVQSGDIYKQTGGTGSFVAQSAGDRLWAGITSTPNGDVYATVRNGGDIYKNAAPTFSGPIQRIFSGTVGQIINTVRDFTTEAGHNNWILKAQQVIVDLTNATYSLVTNTFIGLLGGFFVDNGESITPEIVVASTTIPYTGDASTKTLKWNPSIDWDNSTTCEYSYDNWTTTNTTTCSNNDTSLARPAGGSHTLSLRGSIAANRYSEKEITFFYDNTSPVWTACGSDLLDEARTYYLEGDVTGTCTISNTVTLKGASTTNIVGYTVTGNVVSTNDDFSLQNITIDGAVDSAGGDITLSNSTTTTSTTINASGVSGNRNGGHISILNAIVGALISNGAVNVSGNGGNAGNITVATSTTGYIQASGANGSADGGNGGTISVVNSLGNPISSTITAVGGNSTSCGDGGNGGTVTLTTSSFGVITTDAGSGNNDTCPGGGNTSGSTGTQTVSSPHSSQQSPSVGVGVGAGAGSGSGSSGTSLVNRNITNPLNLTPLPSFNFFDTDGGIFTPGRSGTTVIPYPFRNFKPVTQLVLTPSPKFEIGVSEFLFAPLPGTITDALASAPKLSDFIAAAGVNSKQSLALLATKPLALKDTADGELTPGHFIARQGIQPITTFATYDANLGGVAELIKVNPNQQITLSLIPLSIGEVTATYLNQTLNFVKGNTYHTATLTTPFEPGRYVLRTSSSPVALIIEVTGLEPIAPKQEQESKPWGIFNFVWKLFNT